MTHYCAEAMKTKVKAYRVKAELTQAQLATVSGLSLRGIQRIENGGTPSIPSLMKLAPHLPVTDWTELLEREPA